MVPAFTHHPLLLFLTKSCSSHTCLLSAAPAGQVCAHLIKAFVLQWPPAWNISFRSLHLLTTLSFRSLLKCRFLREGFLNYPQVHSSTLTCLIFFTAFITIKLFHLCVGLLSVSLPSPQLECKIYQSSNLIWFTAATLMPRTMATHGDA